MGETVSNLVDRVLLVGIRHDHAVVLRSHVALHSLPWIYLGSPASLLKPTIRASPLIDVLASSVASDKADCTDVRVIADEVHRVMLPVDHVDHSVRAA